MIKIIIRICLYGRDITNKTTDPIVVRTEDGNYVVLLSDESYEGRQDGVLCPNGTTYKCGTYADVTVFKAEESTEYTFDGGEVGNFFINCLKWCLNLFSDDKLDYNGYYPNKYPTGWWSGEKNFVKKEEGDNYKLASSIKLPVEKEDQTLISYWFTIKNELDTDNNLNEQENNLK